MKIVVKLVDANSSIEVEGRTLLPIVDNTVVKTEAVKTLLKQNVVKFVRNIETPPKAEEAVKKKPTRRGKKNKPSEG